MLSVGEVLSKDEQVVLERFTGKAITTVSEAMLAIAKLGGFVWLPSAPVADSRVFG